MKSFDGPILRAWKKARHPRIGGKAWRKSNGVVDEGAQFTRGDHTVVVRQWEAGHGDTIVLVHGIGMGQQYFGLLRDALLLHANVVAVDLPGFGSSPEPKVSLPMNELADLLGAALDDLFDAPIVALGHSMGTQVVAELAVARPDLVRAVVLIAPTVNDQERQAWRQAMRLLRDLANDPPIVSAVGLKMYVQAGPRWFIKKFASMMEHRIEDVAPRIQQPTLVIRGEEDLVCPEPWVRKVADMIPNATMVTAKGKGHEAMITGAKPVSKQVESFLEELR